MGWFSRKRSLEPDELRDALIEAVRAGDEARLRELFESQRDVIRKHFPAWQKVPESVRADGQRLGAYANGLVTVARYFAARGDSSLLERLTGPADSNPLTRWEAALMAARQSIAARDYARAEPALRDTLGELGSAAGWGLERYSAIGLGLLSQCRFHQGAADEAIVLLDRALEICRRTGDVDGEIAYLESLHEARRWLGQLPEAVGLAEELATAHEGAGHREKAAWARRRAARTRAGEPLVRIVVEIGGQSHELDHLPHSRPEGSVRFNFERDRLPLGGVTTLVDEGSRRGAEGEHERAIAAFERAAALDPSDPRPPYLTGLAQMELGRYADAVQSYDVTERLAPGWFHCRADRWLAAELAAGRVTRAAFVAVRRLEDGGLSAAERARLAAEAIALTPQVPVLYLLRAEALLEEGAAASAETVSRLGLERQPDPDVRTRLLLTLARAVAPPQRRSLLDEAVALDGNRIAAAMARVMLRFEEPPPLSGGGG
jgi:tetratricopeptide (TPR) repeat protein